MADAAYMFTGYATRGYPSYADLETGRMLIADPGGTYQMRAINPGLPVPPDDGRWDALVPAKTTGKAKAAEGAPAGAGGGA